MSESHKGKKQSEETIKKRSDALKGHKGYWEGKHYPKEIREKISKTHKERQVNVREKCATWKGGIINKDGRIFVLKSDHPNVNKLGYVRRSHLVVEKALGRCLNTKKGEMVHHIDGKKDDDRNQNLLICNQGYHTRLEQKIKRLGLNEYFSSLTEERNGPMLEIDG